MYIYINIYNTPHPRPLTHPNPNTPQQQDLVKEMVEADIELVEKGDLTS